MNHLLLLALLCLAPRAVAQETVVVDAAASRFEDSVVRVLASKRQVDFSAPWQFEEVEQQTHLGVVVQVGGKARILTTAYAVSDAAFLEMQKFGSTKKTTLVPLMVDYEVNLALLDLDAESSGERLKPAPIGDDLAVNDKVFILKARDAYQLMRMQASLQEVNIFAAVTSTYNVASYLFKVQQTGLGWSEPVFDGQHLTGIASGQDTNYVYAIPAAVIRHFLEDVGSGSYKGFPALGVQLAPLVSPDMRRLLGAEKEDHGVRVAEVTVSSSFADLLKKDDVLLEVDGQQVSELGFYDHPKWGKLHLRYLLNRRFAGETLRLKVLRAGQAQTVEGKLERFDSNRYPVVIHRYGEPEPHLIVGGFIFQELSRPYLKQWGREWEDVAPLDLMFTYVYENEPVKDPDQRIIFVSRVLADEFNRGINGVKQQVVRTVNGQEVSSMKSLIEALHKPLVRDGRAFEVITFVREGGVVALALDGLSAAHARIATTYEIKSPESFFTP